MNYITVKLTEDQAAELHFQLEMAASREENEEGTSKTFYFLLRIANKLADQLNS